MAADDVFVITGGAGGMGLACAHALADRGRLLLVDLDEDQLEAARAALAADGASVETLRCDVTSPAETAAVSERVHAVGRFRCLVHTAGVSPEMADGPTVLEVDLAGSVRITDVLFPLVEPGSSAILIGSIAGYSEVEPAVEKLLDDPLAEGFFAAVEQTLGRPLDSATAYVLAKRGVMRLAERLAAPWGAKGGRTIALSPGLIDTAMGRLELQRQPIVPVMVEMTPVKRPGQALPGRPQDIAAAVAFLESDAAAFISGCDIRVDGGLVGAGKHMLGVG
ncbi:SDR family oxidoreductase [Mycolicibacterium sp. ELW1]|uniref:SDR family oxidoreductase n=1 Tax=Mycobacteriaceae TaxID=1762 RepID=UPI0011EE1B0B|nr:SDR family oxidoreductase [Mycobacterium sp. ELW1]QEN12913.1 SDR family oxidoreductase [Mycobacterium sp. ELW1]